MKHSIVATLALIAACQPGVSSPAPISAIGVDIAFLSSPALGGRQAGSPGADSAAEFLAQRYDRLGLRPAFRLQCRQVPACPESYFQRFDVTGGTARNVGTVVDGSDSLVRTQFVVLGAHYDALGRSPTYALDRDKGFVIRPGADDNASGTAGLLELARRFRDRPARRSILIVSFDGEELGLLGSRAFLDDPPVPKRAMTFMLNLDMIGRLSDSRVFIEGVQKGATRVLLDSAAAAVGLRDSYVENDNRSDHASFLTDGIDAVLLSTGYHIDYHKTSDIASRIDLVGIERVINMAELIVRRAADRPQ